MRNPPMPLEMCYPNGIPESVLKEVGFVLVPARSHEGGVIHYRAHGTLHDGIGEYPCFHLMIDLSQLQEVLMS